MSTPAFEPRAPTARWRPDCTSRPEASSAASTAERPAAAPAGVSVRQASTAVAASPWAGAHGPPATAPTVCASRRADGRHRGQPALVGGVRVRCLVAVASGPASRRRPSRRRGHRAAGSGPACPTAPGRGVRRARARPGRSRRLLRGRRRARRGGPWSATAARDPAHQQADSEGQGDPANCVLAHQRPSQPAGEIVTARVPELFVRSVSATPRDSGPVTLGVTDPRVGVRRRVAAGGRRGEPVAGRAVQRHVAQVAALRVELGARRPPRRVGGRRGALRVGGDAAARVT